MYLFLWVCWACFRWYSCLVSMEVIIKGIINDIMTKFMYMWITRGLPPNIFREICIIQIYIDQYGSGCCFILMDDNNSHSKELSEEDESIVYQVRYIIWSIINMVLILAYGITLPIIKVGNFRTWAAPPRASIRMLMMD